MPIPGVRALSCEQLDHGTIYRLVVQKFVAVLALEHSDGHTPEALPRDAPVRTCGNHVGDALLAPRRVPYYFFDLFQRAAAQGSSRKLTFHRDEPLLCGAEDDGVVAAPAVRIRVLDLLESQQHAAALQ